jgi:hypothetical protein
LVKLPNMIAELTSLIEIISTPVLLCYVYIIANWGFWVNQNVGSTCVLH